MDMTVAKPVALSQAAAPLAESSAPNAASGKDIFRGKSQGFSFKGSASLAET